jgi:TPR repeat protein
MAELRKFSSKKCPMCRSSLPLSPQELLEEAFSAFVQMRNWAIGDNRYKPWVYAQKDALKMKTVLEKLEAATEQGSHEAFSLLGTIYQGYGCKRDNEKAIDFYSKASKHAQAQFNLSILYYDLGNTKEQEAALERVVELDPTFTAAYQNLGMIQKCKATSEHDPLIASAKQNFERAVWLNPDLVPALNMLGIINVLEGKFEEAIAMFGRSCVAFEKRHKEARHDDRMHYEKTKMYMDLLKSSLGNKKALEEIRALDIELMFKK